MNEIKKLQEERNNKIKLTSVGVYDSDIYSNKEEENQEYYTSIELNQDDEEEEDLEEEEGLRREQRRRINPLQGTLSELIGDGNENNESFYREQNGTGIINTRIADRENEVRRSFSIFK